MNTKKAINVLNMILNLQNERLENFEINILETNENDLKKLLNNYKEKCLACKLELIAEIKKLGGIPTCESIASNKFLHFWLDIKNIFTHTNREDLLPICEYNEYVSLKKIKKILEENIQFLNLNQIQIINNQLILIKKNHDYLKILSEKFLKQIKNHQKKHQSVSL